MSDNQYVAFPLQILNGRCETVKMDTPTVAMATASKQEKPMKLFGL